MDAKPPGYRLLSATTLITGAFVATEILALVVGGSALRAFVFLSVIMFAVGCVAFLWAFGIGVSRSRYETIALSTIFGLSGTSTRGVRLRLFGSIAIETVAAITGAALKPFTPVAFGVLAPMFAVGMTGLWGARYGGGRAAAPIGVADLETADAETAPKHQTPKPESRS